jgi:hypothetical protein
MGLREQQISNIRQHGQDVIERLDVVANNARNSGKKGAYEAALVIEKALPNIEEAYKRVQEVRDKYGNRT